MLTSYVPNVKQKHFLNFRAMLLLHPPPSHRLMAAIVMYRMLRLLLLKVSGTMNPAVLWPYLYSHPFIAAISRRIRKNNLESMQRIKNMSTLYIYMYLIDSFSQCKIKFAKQLGDSWLPLLCIECCDCCCWKCQVPWIPPCCDRACIRTLLLPPCTWYHTSRHVVTIKPNVKFNCLKPCCSHTLQWPI